MAKPNDHTATGSPDVYTGGESSGQTAAAQPRPSEEDLQRGPMGARGVPGQADPAKMTPQRKKKTLDNDDPGHTA